MKTITRTKPKKKLSAFFDRFDDKRAKAENDISAKSEDQSSPVSAVIRSGQLRESFKTRDALADFKADAFHKILNEFIEKGIAFEVSADDFQTIDRAEILKTSDREFIQLNGAAILCYLQQSLLMKHLFSHSPEQFEDFAFEIMERESLLTITAKTPYIVYLTAVMEVTQIWFKRLINEPVLNSLQTKKVITGGI